MNLRNEIGYDPGNFRYFIGDVRDKERLKMALKDVDYLIHSSAIKDLESCEYNPNEALKTNVIGT